MGNRKYQTPTHMAEVQKLATERNGRVEIMVDFILREFSTQLYEAGHLSNFYEPQLQRVFAQDDCNDRFDHYLELDLVKPMGGLGRTGAIQVWGQTTCYKGNEIGAAEPDKTYEVRETLVEALGLRRWLREEGIPFRTVHFTVGPAQYTYSWFETAKKCAFDFSIYLDQTLSPDAIFLELEQLINDTLSETQIHDQLRKATGTPGSQIGQFIKSVLEKLQQWFAEGLPNNAIADQQADLLSHIRQKQSGALMRALSDSLDDIPNIKRRARDLLAGGDTDDVFLIRTLERLTNKKPFLRLAIDALADWNIWSVSNFAVPAGCQELADYIYHLWCTPDKSRLINRRLLRRIHSDGGIRYAQDTGIPGVTEHTLYHEDHTPQQEQELVKQVTSACLKAGIRTPEELFSRLTARPGRQLLKASLAYESKNGTTMTPSFFYLEEVLAEYYNFVSFASASLDNPVGYYSAFGKATVKPYSNMKVIVSKKSGRPIAIIKGKFFRQQEFGRRAKEEAFVGFTTKFEYAGGTFQERYPGIPLIMFVDIEPTCQPFEYAITRLVTAGWEVFFSINRLKSYLDALQTANGPVLSHPYSTIKPMKKVAEQPELFQFSQPDGDDAL